LQTAAVIKRGAAKKAESGRYRKRAAAMAAAVTESGRRRWRRPLQKAKEGTYIKYTILVALEGVTLSTASMSKSPKIELEEKKENRKEQNERRQGT
jgi:hypothetical protein